MKRNPNLNELENMMINIQVDGACNVWHEIELVKKALERCRLRRLYSESLTRLGRNK